MRIFKGLSIGLLMLSVSISNALSYERVPNTSAKRGSYVTRTAAISNKAALQLLVNQYLSALNEPVLPPFELMPHCEDAIAKFSVMIRANPKDVPVYWARASAYLYKRNKERNSQNKKVALNHVWEDCNKAIALEPEKASSFLYRGGIYQRIQNFKEAEKDYGRAIAIAPKDSKTYAARAYVLLYEGYKSKASDDVNTALKLNPNDVAALIVRGFISEESNHNEQGIEDLNKAISLDSNRSNPYFFRAMVYQDRGNYDAAMADYNTLLRLDPQSLIAKIGLISCYESKQKYSDAAALYTDILKQGNVTPDTYGLRAAEYASARNYDKALEDFNLWVKLEPKNKSAYSGRACFYKDWFYWEKVAPELRKKMRKTFPNASVTEAERSPNLGEFTAHPSKLANNAISDFTKAIILDPNDADLYAYRAGVYALLDKDLNALSDLNRALKIQSSGLSASMNYRSRASIWSKLKDDKKALADYAAAIKAIKPDSKNELAQAFRDRGEKYLEIKEYANAIKDFKAADKLSSRPEDRDKKDIEFAYQFMPAEKYSGMINEIIASDPNDPEAIARRGAIYFNRHDYEKALDDYNKSIAIKLSPSALTGRVWVNFELKRYDEAIADCNKAIELEPSASNYQNRAAINAALQKNDSAIADYTKAFELEPTGNSLLVRAQFYEKLDNYDLAVRDYEDYLAVNGNSKFDSTTDHLFNYCCEHGKFREAIEVKNRYGTSLAEFDNTQKAYEQIAKRKNGIEDFSKIIKADPKDIDAYDARAKMYAAINKFPEAISDCTIWIALEPKSWRPYVHRADLYQKCERYADAIRDYTSAIALEPKFDFLYYDRAFAYKAIGDKKHALEDYDHSTSLLTGPQLELQKSLRSHFIGDEH